MEELTCKGCKKHNFTSKRVITDPETKEQSWKTREEMVQPASLRSRNKGKWL